ncbi:hypothetical protein BOX15_Mlig021687g2, partial [Macrostomum lignano]
ARMRTTRPLRALLGSPLAKLQLGGLAEAAAEMRRLQAALDALEAEASAGGGPRGHQRHCSVNKKVAPRQRLRMLFDGGKFCEINRLAGHGMPYGTVPAAGSITAFGRISDRLCIAAANDATVKGGTLYPIGVKKMLRLQELSGTCRIPIVYLVDSGGAFLPLQSEIFPDAQHGGRTFFNEATLNARGVAQLALVLGSSTAGGAYVPTMCDQVVMVDRIGHVFLGGPPLVQAALGEVVSADELGGAALHSHTSGCSDHFAGDEAEGFRLMREIAGTLPRPPPPPPAEPPTDPMFPSAELASLGLNLLPREGEARRIGLLNILARLLDSSQLLEFKPTFSHGLVCGFGRICGRTVGLMGSWTRLGEKDAVKGAHFLELCGHRGLPLVSLVHTEPDLPEPAGSEALAESAAACLRAKARMMALSAAFPLPRLSLIVGDAAGCDYFLMGGRCMSPDFLLAWPNGRLSERLDAAEPGADAFKAAGQLWIDDVIRPAETRLQLDRLLRLSLHYSGLPVHSAGPVARQQQPSGSRPTYWPSYPILRM